MKKTELYVPEQIRYISKWKELFNYLPKYGKYILNKALPDCGASTAFIGLNRPVILASPRKTMLNSKARQIPEAFYFKAGTPPNDFRKYICSCRSCGKQPKILVTWDSLGKVIRALTLQNYRHSWWSLMRFNVSLEMLLSKAIQSLGWSNSWIIFPI